MIGSLGWPGREYGNVVGSEMGMLVGGFGVNLATMWCRAEIERPREHVSLGGRAELKLIERGLGWKRRILPTVENKGIKRE